jgi:hypothetical protein
MAHSARSYAHRKRINYASIQYLRYVCSLWAMAAFLRESRLVAYAKD